jgi:hypothetical protein
MIRSTLLAATVIALMEVQPALATEPERQGIENSRKAGIYVDPLMERFMAQAPIGTCVNDPSRTHCPDVTAIVYAPEFFDIPEDQRPTIAASVSHNRTRRLLARSAAYNCGVKFVRNSPYKAAGYEQADAQNFCSHPIPSSTCTCGLTSTTTAGGTTGWPTIGSIP